MSPEKLGREPKPGFSGAGRADDTAIQVPGVGRIFRARVHGKKFRPGENDIILKLGIDKGLYILFRSKAGGAILLIPAVLFGVFAFRVLFIFQEGERQIGLGNDFDRKILASIYNKRPAGWRKGLRAAAVLLLLIGVSQVLIDIGNPQKDTCQTPEQALAEVRQALNFVSSKMNRGQQLLEENMDEMKWINRYIK